MGSTSFVPVVPADGRLALEQLRTLAGEFDSISQEVGETYPATTFVDWLATEASSRGLTAAANTANLHDSE